jgi:hypothetical protein
MVHRLPLALAAAAALAFAAPALAQEYDNPMPGYGGTPGYGGGTPAPSAPGGGGGATAAASITRVTVTKVNGVRVVRATFRVPDHANATAQLRRGRRTVAAARRHLMPGTRVIQLRVPRSAAAGAYTLRVVVSALSGQRSVLSRAVRLPG